MQNTKKILLLTSLFFVVVIVLALEIESKELWRNNDCPTSIVFHKTHKTASTTIQNIMLRLTMKHNLTLLIPEDPDSHQFMSRIRPEDYRDQGANIHCLHSLHWSYRDMQDIMGINSAFFTVLREPISQFISGWDYNHGKHYGFNSIDNLVNSNNAQKQRIGILSLSRILNDFLIEDFTNAHVAKETLQKLDREFPLVMITERFDESLILMKDYLCLTFDDITYLKLNSMDPAEKTVISEDTAIKLRSLLNSSYVIYDHFVKRFEQQVQDYGELRMRVDVEVLRNNNEDLVKRCKIRSIASKAINGLTFGAKNDRVVGYKLDKSSWECRLAAMRETAFIAMIRDMRKTEDKDFEYFSKSN